uniref:S1 self-incompatibility locus-linked pollen G211 protein n=3 Tax=Petunia integrifolia subsp. inflata TaxID=212142 RepID=Q6WIX2_PETIN|nr:S1 self-incompatibility locus-linked pollen G211 protein [Petunia integrifolia subsp. inflata]
MLAATVEAEELYLKCRKLSLQNGEGQLTCERCFTGVCLNKDAIGSPEAQEALLAAASKHKVPCAERLAGVAAHCNERKLASRHVKDATEKLYMWVLLKKKKILLSDARVLALGPRFMTLYIHKLAIERRIYYDEVEGLIVEWLDCTSTLVLSPSVNKRFNRRGSPGKCRALDEVAFIVNPCKLNQEPVVCEQRDTRNNRSLPNGDISRSCNSDVKKVEPAVFPMTLRLLSTIPVALHADGGGDGPLEIGVRLFVSSYFT